MVDLKRLVADRLARRALLIWTLWNLAPGSATPLQFYIQDLLGGTTGQWGQWNALYTAAFIPTFLLFGILCSRVAFQDLLRWGTLIAIPQFVPLLVVGSHVTLLYTAAGRNNANATSRLLKKSFCRVVGM